MRRGVVVSLDTLVALLVLLTILSISTFYLGQVDYKERNNRILKESAMDVLTVMEKGGVFEEAVSTSNVDGIRTYINRLPNNICVDVVAYSADGTALFSVLRAGCSKDYLESATMNRSFVVQDGQEADFHYAKATVWFG